MPLADSRNGAKQGKRSAAPKFKPVPTPDTQDNHRGVRKANAFKKTAPYRVAVRAAYGAQTPETRRARVQTAQAHRDRKGPSTFNGLRLARYSPEDKIILAEHTRRQSRLAALSRVAGNVGDTKNDISIGRSYVGADSTGQLTPRDRHAGHDVYSSSDAYLGELQRSLDKGLGTSRRGRQDLPQELAAYAKRYGDQFAFNPSEPPADTRTGKPQSNYSDRLTGDLRETVGLPRSDEPQKGGAFNLGALLNPFSQKGFLAEGGNIAGNALGTGISAIASGEKALSQGLADIGVGRATGGPGGVKIAQNAAHDAVDFYAQAVPSIAFTLQHPKKAAEQAAGMISLKGFKEHPLFVPLLLHGAVRAGGRVAGVSVRTAGRATGNARLKGIGSTQGRAPIIDPLTGKPSNRIYSGDLVAKYAQKGGDRLGRKLDAGATARREAGKPAKLRDTLYLKSQAHNMKRNADYLVGENTRRLNRNQVRQDFAKARPRKFGDLVAFINDATVKSAKTMSHDLAKERDRLSVERDKIAAEMEGKIPGPKLTALREKLKESEASIARVQSLLDNKEIKSNPEKAFEKADKAAAGFAERQAEIDRLRVERGDLVAAQAEKAKYINWAVREMGATMDHEARLTDRGAEHVAREEHIAELDKEIKRAERNQQNARVTAAREEGGSKVAVAHEDQKAILREPAVRATGRVHLKNVRDVQATRKGIETLKAEGAPKAKLDKARERLDRLVNAREKSRSAHDTARATAGERLRQEPPRKAPALGTKPVRRLARLERIQGELHARTTRLERLRRERKAAKKDLKDNYVLKDNRTFIPGLTKDGEPLSVEQIHETMKDAGVNTDRLAFISSRRFGSSAGYVSPSRAPYERRFTLTGATRQYSVHSELDALNSQMRGQGVIDALDNRLAIQDQFVVPAAHSPDGTPLYHDTYAEALAHAKHMEAVTGHAMTVYRVHDPRLTYKQFEQYKRNLDTSDEEAHMLADQHFEASLSPAEGVMDEAAVAREGTPNGKFGVMAADVAKQLQAHEQVTSKLTVDRGIQAFTQRWRHAILYGSSAHTWTMGNTAELLFRLTVAGAGARSLWTGRKILAQLDKALEEGRIDKQAHSRTRAILLSGGHFTGTQSLIIRDAFRDDRGTMLKAIQDLADKPGVKQLRIAWETWTRGVLAVNRTLEHGGDVAALGKLALSERETFREFNKTWVDGLTIGKEAAAQVANRLLETPEQIRYARHIYKVIGNYTTLPPSVRKFIGTYSTFGLWYGNAIKFLYFTLPKDHPLVTAALAATYVASEKDRKELGAGMFMGDNRLPDFLQGSVHLGHINLPFFPDIHDGTYRFNRYLPFGAVGDPAVAANQILPQFEGVTAALRGVDFKDSPLLNSKDKKLDAQERFIYALYSTLETMIPFASNARKAREKGGKPYATSYLFSPKTKKGTQDLSIAGALGRAFNPLAPVKNSTKKKSGSGSLPTLPGLPPLPGAP